MEINRKQLKSLWLPPIFPEKMHPTLISLLNKFDVAFWSQDKDLLYIPFVLSQGIPNNIDLYWIPMSTLYKEDKLSVENKNEIKGIKQYSRFYFFEFLPIYFHHLLMVRLLREGWKMQVGWELGTLI